MVLARLGRDFWICALFSICAFGLAQASCNIFSSATLDVRALKIQLTKHVTEAIHADERPPDLATAIATHVPPEKYDEVFKIVQDYLEARGSASEIPAELINAVVRVFGSENAFELIEVAYADASFALVTNSFADPPYLKPSRPRRIRPFRDFSLRYFLSSVTNFLKSRAVKNRQRGDIGKLLRLASEVMETEVRTLEDKIQNEEAQCDRVAEAIINQEIDLVETAKNVWNWDDALYYSKKNDWAEFKASIVKKLFRFPDEVANEEMLAALGRNIGNLRAALRVAVITEQTDLYSTIRRELTMQIAARDRATVRARRYKDRTFKILPFTKEQAYVLAELKKGNSEPLDRFLGTEENAVITEAHATSSPSSRTRGPIEIDRLKAHPRLKAALTEAQLEGLQKKLLADARSFERAELSIEDVREFNQNLRHFLDIRSVSYSATLSSTSPGNRGESTLEIKLSATGYSPLNHELRNVADFLSPVGMGALPVAFTYRSVEGTIPTRTFFDYSSQTVYLSAVDLILNDSQPFTDSFRAARDHALVMTNKNEWRYQTDVYTPKQPFRHQTWPTYRPTSTGFSFSEIVILRRSWMRRLDAVLTKIEMGQDPAQDLEDARDIAFQLREMLRTVNILSSSLHSLPETAMHLRFPESAEPSNHPQFRFSAHLDGNITIIGRVPYGLRPEVVSNYHRYGADSAKRSFFSSGITIGSRVYQLEKINQFLALNLGESPEEIIAFHREVNSILSWNLSPGEGAVRHDLPERHVVY